MSDLGSYRVLQGHVLDVLQGLPSESVQCWVTSPPYYGLRDYQLPPTIWGGDVECAHSWGDAVRSVRANGLPGPGGVRLNSKSRGVPKEAGAFCMTCGAWRGNLGLEPTPELYVAHLVEVFNQVRRVLRKDGTLWLNIGDTYANNGKGGKWDEIRSRGSKNGGVPGYNYGQQPNRSKMLGSDLKLKYKDLMGIPWMVAFALRDSGWYLRSDVIWHKPNGMCESVTDRPHRSHEYIFLLTKSPTYFYDAEAVRNPLAAKTYTTFGSTRSSNGAGDPLVKSQNWLGTERKPALNHNGQPVGSHKRTVWSVGTTRYKGAHFATYPPKLIEPCIRSSSSEHGCCSVCGAPWRRVIERKGSNYIDRKARGVGGPYNKNADRRGVYGRLGSQTSTTGWEPTCNHESAPVVPCLVGDPFSGVGTTGVVALGLGRSYLGAELNPEYVAMGKRRVVDELGLLGWAALQEAEVSEAS
jgi:DNA modification methylase